MCLNPYPEYKLECDHIIPLQQGGEDSSKNTQTLCINCHRLKTNLENNYSRKDGLTPTLILIDELHTNPERTK